LPIHFQYNNETQVGSGCMTSSLGSEKCGKHRLLDDEDSVNNVDCCYVFNCILEMKVVASGSRAQNARSGIIKNVWVHMAGKHLCVHSATLAKYCA
jgi:hypothetical protein